MEEEWMDFDKIIDNSTGWIFSPSKDKAKIHGTEIYNKMQ